MIKAGFSLIEAIAAMVILSIAAISAIAATSSNVRAAARARHVLEATALADATLGDVLTRSPLELDALMAQPGHQLEIRSELEEYQRFVTVTRAPNGLYQAEVRVTWEHGTVNLISRRPPGVR